MLIDTAKIKQLIDSDITGYRVEKLTNGKIKQQMYDRYRTKQSKFDRMPLLTAMELMKIIDSTKES
ncbi:hypothetical protein [Aerococcus kribbianus]|uniref:Uncharacterized protein n=1 Tax=Aerococcus kribbianus TaxID=2999064 RepID=A0A9X3FV07_9LACT|nr:MULTISPECIES: hypothetical protein [unclassified Aerococcus]MCZ0716744.1 hypothetical protein [Aerococcus sp. YH-aer221]MCZ0725032.1 hypothetical protein [Aerococcus sp. YH-aer222]